MALYKLVNGEQVELTQAEVDEYNQRIANHTAKLESSEYQLEVCRLARSKAYLPIGDQLDAILKQLNYMRLNGTEMTAPMDSLLNSWLAVKANHPKPGE